MRRPATAKPKPRRTINPVDHEWSGIYGALMDQYQEAPGDWHVVMTAIRLFARRHAEEGGFSLLLSRLKTHGVPWVAVQCRNELVMREEFFDRMLKWYPPADPADAKQGREEIAIDLRLLDTPDGGMRLLRVLDRLLEREKTLKLGNHKVSH